MPEGDIVDAELKHDIDDANQPDQPTILPAHDEEPPAVNSNHADSQDGIHTEELEIKREADGEVAAAQPSRKRKHDSITKSLIGSTHISPPWKKFSAEGPTTFLDKGKRRSGRTNTLPIELQPPSEHRRTRAEANKGKPRPSYSALHNGVAKEKKKKKKKLDVSASPRAKKQKAAQKSNAEFKVPTAKSQRRQSESVYTTPTKRRSSSSAMYGSPSTPRRYHVPAQHSGRSRRFSQMSQGESPAQHNGIPNTPSAPPSNGPPPGPSKFQRLRLRFREPIMPKTSPGHFPLPRRYASFADWLQHDDPLEGEEKLRLSDDQARREALVRIRIIKAAQPGGSLSADGCSKYLPEEWSEPQTRYGHAQHLTAHAVRFQKLMVLEHEKHVKHAKQVASACQVAVHTLEKWAFLREAKTQEQIEAEERTLTKIRKRQVMKDLEVAWALARNEVAKLRQMQWQEEQDALGKQALDEMFDNAKAILTRQYLDADASEDLASSADGISRRSHTDVDSETSGDATDDGEESSSKLNDEYMSESSDEEDVENIADEDEDLSPEALQAKYAHLLTQQEAAPNESGERGENRDAEEEVGLGNDAEVETEGHADDEEDEASVDLVMNGTSGHLVDEDAHDDMSTGIVSHALMESHGLLDEQANLQDYGAPELEEVDEALLDSDDDSTDMSSDMGTDDDESGSEDGSGSASDEDSYGMLGFLSKPDLQALENARTEEEAGKEDELFERDKPQTNGVHNEDEAEASELMEMDEPIHEIKEPSQLDTDSAPTANGAGMPLSLRPSPLSHSLPHTPTSDRTPSTPRRHYKTEIPTQLLRGTLREYQHDGLDWLAKLYSGGRNGILADEMGLGKTIQTIALLAHVAVQHEVWGPHLVVVPTSVILNWEMEFKKWCPGFKILTYYGTQDERKKKRQGWLNDDLWNVCITSYQLILQDAAAFKKRSWHYLILDEAHNIKNFQTQRWQTLLTFKTHSRLLLTGTPLQNNLQELWSLLYFLMPAGTDGAGGFADLEKFLNSMKRPADQILDQGRQKLDAEAQARVNKLHEVLRPYLLRRLKSEVEKQMPGKYEHVVYCRLSKRQRQLYDEFMGRADTKRTLASGNYMSIINCLMSLRKVCNHPDLFETRQIVTSFAMPKSAVADYEITELLVRRRLLAEEKVDLDFCGLVPTNFEWDTRRRATRTHDLQPTGPLLDLVERQTRRLKPPSADYSSLSGALAHVEADAQQGILEQLENHVVHVKRTTQRWPISGADLVAMLTMPDRFRPAYPRLVQQRTEGLKSSCTPGQWYLDNCRALYDLMPTLPDVAERSEALVSKFSCVTPIVVAEDVLPLTITSTGRKLVQSSESLLTKDPYHEARIRLSIQFPDRRLLQYDCGKLQALAKLLRELQAGGHRCLIFTQMTKVLDILEQFLNIHGHRYLRLDGATKIEQRQILTDRFNSDNRILAFILSSRSGGLGINLTGADTVIFYDLDWNPAMDAQCQDRCHRIGQTRDVHIYRFVSEYTIEANILRKSNQKRLLDDVIIQKGEFTTDYFNRVTYRDAFADEDMQGDAEASAAMDRILGEATGLDRVFDAVEDKEDTVAAKVATKEMSHIDDADFNENTQPNSTPKTSAPQTPGADGASGQEAVAALDTAVESANMEEQQLVEDVELPHVDEYMVRFLQHELRNVAIVPPAALQKKRPQHKKGKDWQRGR